VRFEYTNQLTGCQLVSLKLSPASSQTQPVASIPLTVPGFVIPISRVRPRVSVSISEVRLRIPVRVILICVVRSRRAIRVVLTAVIGLRVAIRVRSVTRNRPSLVNHIGPLIVINHDSAAMLAARSLSSLTESGDWKECAQDKRTNHSLKNSR